MYKDLASNVRVNLRFFSMLCEWEYLTNISMFYPNFTAKLEHPLRTLFLLYVRTFLYTAGYCLWSMEDLKQDNFQDLLVGLVDIDHQDEIVDSPSLLMEVKLFSSWIGSFNFILTGNDVSCLSQPHNFL